MSCVPNAVSKEFKMMTNAQKEWNAAWRDARINIMSDDVDVDTATTPLDDEAIKCLVRRQTRRMDLRDRLLFFKSKRGSLFLD